MSKHINKIKTLLEGVEKDLKDRWDELSKDFEEMRKVLPGLVPPWAANQNIQVKVTSNGYFNRGGIRQLIMAVLPENANESVSYSVIRNSLRDSGYKDGYIYNAMNKMETAEDVVDGFRIGRFAPDEQSAHPRFFKVRVTQNA